MQQPTIFPGISVTFADALTSGQEADQDSWTRNIGGTAIIDDGQVVKIDHLPVSGLRRVSPSLVGTGAPCSRHSLSSQAPDLLLP